MHPFQNYYAKLNFERAGLFEAMRDSYRCRDVLYPGCSVHITPSLYFPHVVYVDQSQAAAEIFANEASLLEYLSRHKRYKPSAYVRFIRQDYSQPLPLRPGTFDLLLSLFTGGIARSCVQYLRPGGLLLTNNHQGDAVDTSLNQELRLKALVRFQKGKYVITEEGPHKSKIPAQKQNSNYLTRSNQGMAYVENELYYLFERVH